MLQKVANYVKQQFRERHNPKLLYHNLQHTKTVVETCAKMATYSQLSSLETDNLLIAAWFHDIGYLHTYYRHEAKSIEIATAFLEKEKYKSVDIEVIINCIAATEVGEIPSSTLAAMLKDADLAYGATDEVPNTAALIRKEWELTIGKTYTDKEWEALQHTFFERIRYYSVYGQQHFSK